MTDLVQQHTETLDVLNAVYQPKRNRMVAAEVADGYLKVRLADGRVIHVPLDWLPTVAAATPEQQRALRNTGASVYWPDLEDGISLEVMLLGRADEP